MAERGLSRDYDPGNAGVVGSTVATRRMMRGTLNEENFLLQAQPSVQTPSTGLRHPSWRKVPQSDARSVPSALTQSNYHGSTYEI